MGKIKVEIKSEDGLNQTFEGEGQNMCEKWKETLKSGKLVDGLRLVEHVAE